jgi:transposase
MQTPTFVGFDVHRNTVVATALDPMGHRVNQETLGPSDAELVRYLERLPSGPKRVVLEACSVWEHFFDAAASTGAEVILSNPKKTKAIAEAELKSDRVDSETLAELLRLNGIPEAYAPEEETRRLRRLVLERLFYLSKEKAIRSHLYSVLLRKGIPYDDGIMMRRAQRETLRELGIPEIDRGLDALVHLDETTKRLDHAVHDAFEKSTDAKLLSTIPGVGEITALTLVAFLCPIDRFPSIDKVSSYCGLRPTNHQSADTVWHGKLVRNCNHVLRWVLIEASWCTRRYEPRGDVAKVGKRISRRKGSGRSAVAAAHKLLKICYAVLKRRTPYQPHAPEPEGRNATAADPSGCRT